MIHNSAGKCCLVSSDLSLFFVFFWWSLWWHHCAGRVSGIVRGKVSCNSCRDKEWDWRNVCITKHTEKLHSRDFSLIRNSSRRRREWERMMKHPNWMDKVWGCCALSFSLSLSLSLSPLWMFLYAGKREKGRVRNLWMVKQVSKERECGDRELQLNVFDPGLCGKRRTLHLCASKTQQRKKMEWLTFFNGGFVFHLFHLCKKDLLRSSLVPPPSPLLSLSCAFTFDCLVTFDFFFSYFSYLCVKKHKF